MSYYGYLKLAENNTHAEYDSDENSNIEVCNNENIGYIESIGQDSDLDSSDIEVPFGGI